MPAVTLVPNRHRPGVGHAPVRDGRRQVLPQIAIHCPVVSAANSLGYLVYPALADGEAFQIRYRTDSRFEFSFFVGSDDPPGTRAFTLRYTFSGVGPGRWTEELVHHDAGVDMGDDQIMRRRDALFSVANLAQAQPGSVGLRGATNFVTPEGWDTVFTGVLNDTTPPRLPVVSVRVETDWFAMESEFRYVLQPGDSLSAGPGDPVGQAFFVPREPVTARPASSEEQASFDEAFERYQRDKRAEEIQTPSGFRYSPAYSRRMGRPRG